MKKSRRCTLALAVFLVAIVAFSTFTYATNTGRIKSVIGTVMVKQGEEGNWRRTYTGMTITEGMAIKVERSSRCEIQIGSSVVNLAMSGTYPMDRILAQPDNARQTIMNILTQERVAGRHNPISAHAGVRGDEVVGMNVGEELITLDENFGNGNPIEDAYFFLEKADPDFEGAIMSLSQNALSNLAADKKAEGYFLLGWTYFQMGKFQEAIEPLKTSLASSPAVEKEGQILLFLALSLNSTGQYAESNATAQKIIDNSALAEYKGEAYALMATNFMMLGQEERADEYLSILENNYTEFMLDVE